MSAGEHLRIVAQQNYIGIRSGARIFATERYSFREMSIMATVPRTPENDESFHIILEQETDGRWLAEVPELPGVMAYGATENDAKVAVTALALRVIADRTEEAKKPPRSIQFRS